MVYLDQCGGSWNADDDLSAKMFVPNKTKDINFEVFNMIARSCETKTLIKHI